MKKCDKTFIHEVRIYSIISLLSISFLIAFLVLANKDSFVLSDDFIELRVDSNYSILSLGKKNSDGLHYSSDDESILTIDKDGNIHAKKIGQTYVTVKSKYGLFESKVKVNVSDFNVYSIKFEEESIDLNVGDSTFVDPVINNNANIKSNLEWKSSDDNIASVTNGNIKTYKSGSAIITVSDKSTNLSTNIIVNVKSDDDTEYNLDNSDIVLVTDEDEIKENEMTIDVKDIKLNTTRLTMYIGDIKKITSIVEPSDATDKTLNYSTSNSSIATVNKYGYIVAKKTGICNIFVTSSDGNVTASLTVNVIGEKIGIEKFKIAETNLTLSINETYMLTKKITPTNASDKKITYSISNPRVASIDDNGKIKAIYPGEATIVAVTRDNHIVSSTNLVVRDKVVTSHKVGKYTINRDTRDLKVGETRKLKINILDEYNSPIKYILTTSDNEIASIDQEGNLTALSPGMVLVDIETTDGSLHDQILYTILPGEILPEFVYFNRKTLQLKIGDSFELKAFVLPEYSSNKEIVWSSGNPNIASVDDKGNVTAHSIGTVYIYAEVKGTSIKNSMKIAVVNNEKLIDIRNKKLTGYNLNFKIYDEGTNFMRAMQNFVIWNKGTPNEHLFVSMPTRTLLTKDYKLTNSLKKDLTRTIIIDIPKSEMKKPGSKNRQYMYLNNSGHGQTIDIENNGKYIWTNGNGFVYRENDGKYWGDNLSIVRVKYKANKENSNYSSAAKIDIKNGNNYYTSLELSFDLKNNLAAIRSGRQIFIVKAGDLVSGKKTLLYSFVLNSKSIDGTNYPRQGFDISDGYFYVYRGYAKTKMYIEVYNYVGELQYVYTFNPKLSNQEAEGLKIYDDSLYVGVTSNCKGCNGKINSIYYFN